MRPVTSDSIQGTVVHLRPATSDDKWMIYHGLARSDLTDTLVGHPDQSQTPVLTWQAFCNDYVSHYFDDSEPYAGRCFAIEVSGRAVGQVNYNEIDKTKKRTELDIWMFCEAECGHGYGPDALTAICEYLSQRFDVREFVMGPSASNERAIRAYEKAGFRKTGVPPEEAKREYGPGDSIDTIYMTKSIEQADAADG